MSSTRVFQVAAAAARDLEQRLRRELPVEAEWRRVDHARFAVKLPGASLVCYLSGKVVLQGKAADAFAARFLDGLAAAPTRQPAPPDPALCFDAPTIGADEAGKGDYFGPLVAAAVHADPAHTEELRAMGVADSKRLSDRRMFPLAEHIERTLPCEVRTLMPAEYNERWRRQPNVNLLLAELHAEAIAALLERCAAAVVVVDRFGDERLVRDGLRRRGAAVPPRLVQVPRAEAHPVVAAASVVARVRFLEGLQQCEADSGTELHKGAGPPVDVAARRAFAIGGHELMGRIAKLHFKNSDRVPGLNS